MNAVSAAVTGWSLRSAITAMWIKGHPHRSARARRIAALGSLAAQDSAGARTHVASALRVLNDDPDPALEFNSVRRGLLDQLRALADRLGVAP